MKIPSIKESLERQQKYKANFAPVNSKEYYEELIKCLGHLMEEVIEARQEVPRRDWRVEEYDPEAFLMELVDISLWLSNTAATAGFSDEQWDLALLRKMQYNKKRADHTKGSR